MNVRPVAGKQGACDVHEADDFYSREFLGTRTVQKKKLIL